MAPQFIICTAILVWSLRGHFFSVVTSHFPLLLCPIFTCFSFGPVNWRTNSFPKSITVSPLITTINVLITVAVNFVMERVESPSYENILDIFNNCTHCEVETIPLLTSLTDLHPGPEFLPKLYYLYFYCTYLALFVGGICTIILVNSEKVPIDSWNMTEFGVLCPQNIEKQFVLGKNEEIQEFLTKKHHWLQWMDHFNPFNCIY